MRNLLRMSSPHRLPSLIALALVSVVAVAISIPCDTVAAPSATCSDASYDEMLQHADGATARNDKREVSRLFTDAAHARLRCAEVARGDQRASLIDDFAGSIENAVSASVGAADYARACRLAHEEVDVLQDQLRHRDMTSLWQRTLRARLSGPISIYRPAKWPRLYAN